MGQAVFGRAVDEHIASIGDLRVVTPAPDGPASFKEIDHVDDLAARFIAAAPLAFLATRRANGDVDVTPRGDPGGFVRVLDRKTVALPDRPGNRRMEALSGIVETGTAALLFVIPGRSDSLRLAGQAAVVRDANLGREMAVNGRSPELIALIRVERVFSHCSKAFVRSRAWQPESWPGQDAAPPMAELIKAHCALADDLREIEAHLAEDVRDRLY